jgi:hypothetical protein
VSHGHITKKEEKLTREEDVDYRASFNGAQVSEITKARTTTQFTRDADNPPKSK